MNQDIVNELIKNTPNEIAEMLLSVQPMNIDLSRLMEEGMNEVDLVDQGFEKVSKLGLLWIKREINE